MSALRPPVGKRDRQGEWYEASIGPRAVAGRVSGGEQSYAISEPVSAQMHPACSRIKPLAWDWKAYSNGNDVFAVQAMSRCREKARSGGPTLIEACTYRIRRILRR
jgi:hypothetical protein